MFKFSHETSELSLECFILKIWNLTYTCELLFMKAEVKLLFTCAFKSACLRYNSSNSINNAVSVNMYIIEYHSN